MAEVEWAKVFWGCKGACQRAIDVEGNVEIKKYQIIYADPRGVG